MTQQNRVSADPIPKKPNEVLFVSVDMTLYGLRVGETLTGTPTVTDPAGALTIADIAVNTATFTNRRGKTVAIGKGVQFTVAGGVDGTNYDLAVQCGTSGSPAQTLEGTCPIEVRSSD